MSHILRSGTARPSHALDLLEHDPRVLRQAGIEKLPFETELGKAPNGSDTTFIRKPLRDVNFDLFSKSDLKIFDEVIAKYGNSSFKELMDITHEHKAYKEAWENRRQGNRAEMYYEEMIEDEGRRKALLEDLRRCLLICNEAWRGLFLGNRSSCWPRQTREVSHFHLR